MSGSTKLGLALFGAGMALACVSLWPRRETSANLDAPAGAARDQATRLEQVVRERDATIADLRRQIADLSRSVTSLTATVRHSVPAPVEAVAPSEVVKDDRGPGSATARENAALAWLQRVLGEKFKERGAAAIEFLRHGTQLDLRGAAITDADLENLWAMPNLKSLGLRGTTITDAGLRHLAALPKLEFLELRATSVTGAGLAALPVSLAHVDLTDTQAGSNGFHGLPPLPRLATLKLNRLPVGDDDLDVLPRWPLLSHLEIDGTKVTAAGLRRLVAGNPHLTRIEVRGLSLTSEQLSDLQRLHPGIDIVWAEGVASFRVAR